jgi:hypothetical protein
MRSIKWLAFVVASATMVASTQILLAQGDDNGREDTNIIFTFDPDFVKRLEKQLSEEEQEHIETILTNLNGLSDESRFFLLASTNVCAVNIINCLGLSSDVVKPIVSVALEQQKAAMERHEHARTFLVSIGSLAISFSSLVLSVLAFRKKAKEANAETLSTPINGMSADSKGRPEAPS